MRKKEQPSLPVLSLPYGINECGALLVDTAKKEKTEGKREIACAAPTLHFYQEDRRVRDTRPTTSDIVLG